MVREETFLLCLVIILAAGGCETSSAVKDQQYYLSKARGAIENYRMTERKEFYGFVLGEELEDREHYHGTADEDTGGTNYVLKDERGVFDTVKLTTDQSGIVLRITLLKKFNTNSSGLTFFNTIAEKLKATYPAYETQADTDFAHIIVLVAEDDNDWLRRYSEHLRRKEQMTYYRSTFRHVLHPTLARTECVFLKRPEAGYMVLLEYSGKQYARIKELHKKDLQQKFGEL